MQTISLEKLKTNITLLDQKSGFDELIDSEMSQRLFGGLLPVIENDIPLDFPEIHGVSSDGNLLMSSACLLTGETGSGKHTIAYAFAKSVKKWIEDNMGEPEPDLLMQTEPDSHAEDILFMYTVDFELLSMQYGMKMPQVLTELNHAFSELCLTGGENNQVIFLLIENIAGILKKRKTAVLFRHFVDSLLFQPDTPVFIAAVCEDKAENICEDCKPHMMIYECSLPTDIQRTEYLQRFAGRYVNIRLGYSPEDIQAFTENFTYGQMEQLQNMLIMIAKSRSLSSRCPVSRLMSDSPYEKKIEIYPYEIEEVCSMVRNNRYRKPLPYQQAVMTAPPASVPSPPETEVQTIQQEEALKNIPTFNTIGDTMKAIKASSSVEMPPLYARNQTDVQQKTVSRQEPVSMAETGQYDFITEDWS